MKVNSIAGDKALTSKEPTMSLTRCALTSATLLTLAAAGTGCTAVQSDRSAQNRLGTVRMSMLDEARNPYALAAGDALGTALFLNHSR